MKNKIFYRDRTEQFRSKLTAEEKLSMDLSIYNKLIKASNYEKAKVIFIYVSYKNEVETHKIIKHALENGKKVCVPKIVSLKEGMEAVEIENLSELKVNKYGILEPEFNLEKIMAPDCIDLMIVPGVAFDRNGGRVGYGGGFYDRFINRLHKKVYKLALAYNFQIYDKVPMEENDMYIDDLISE